MLESLGPLCEPVTSQEEDMKKSVSTSGRVL